MFISIIYSQYQYKERLLLLGVIIANTVSSHDFCSLSLCLGVNFDLWILSGFCEVQGIQEKVGTLKKSCF